MTVKFPSGTPLSEEELLRYDRGEGVWREVARGPNWVKGEWAQQMYVPSYDYFRNREDHGSEPGL